MSALPPPPDVRVEIMPANDFDTSTNPIALSVGSLVFAATGALLAMLFCLAVRKAARNVPKGTFASAVGLAIPIAEIFILAGLRVIIDGKPFTLSYLYSMRWQGWVMLLVSLLAAILVARQLGPPARLKVGRTFD